MKISRELALKILKYLYKHSRFYFPFLVMCKEYSVEDDDFVEIEPGEWKIIRDDKKYQTFELWENLQNLDEKTTKLMATGFVNKITGNYLKKDIANLAKKYRKGWKEELWGSKDIEEFGSNEFIGGKAEGYEECLKLLEKYEVV